MAYYPQPQGQQFQQYQPQYSNPILEQQINRLNQYQQQLPQYQQQLPQYQPQGQQFQQPQAPAGNVIKAVTSIDEVKSITPSFDGSKMYFEDVTSGKMYIKYLGMNGLPILEIYGKEEKPVQTETTTTNIDTTQFVARKEFDELKAKIGQYETIFNDLMGGKKE